MELPPGFVLTDSAENTSNDTYAIDLTDPDAGLQPWGEDTWREARLLPDGERLLVFPYHAGPLLVDREGNTIAQLSEGINRRNQITRAKTKRAYRTIRVDDETVQRFLNWRTEQDQDRTKAGPVWLGNADGGTGCVRWPS